MGADQARRAPAGRALTNNFPTKGEAGHAYSGTITVFGGHAPYTWTPGSGLSPSLGIVATPSGATLTFSGIPDAGGISIMDIQVHDSSTPQRTATERIPVSVQVKMPPLTFIQLPTYPCTSPGWNENATPTVPWPITKSSRRP